MIRAASPRAAPARRAAGRQASDPGRADRVAARLGYRRAGWQVDSDENDDELDFSLAGLTLGFGVTF